MKIGSYVKGGVQSSLIHSGLLGSVLEDPTGSLKEEEIGTILVFILGEGQSNLLGSAPDPLRCSSQFEPRDASGWEE